MDSAAAFPALSPRFLRPAFSLFWKEKRHWLPKAGLFVALYFGLIALFLFGFFPLSFLFSSLSIPSNPQFLEAASLARLGLVAAVGLGLWLVGFFVFYDFLCFFLHQTAAADCGKVGTGFWRYLWKGFLVFLVSVFASGAISLIGDFFINAPLSSPLIQILGGLINLYIVTRFFLVAPLCAQGNPNPLSKSWQITKGWVWALLWRSGFLLFASFLAGGLLLALFTFALLPLKAAGAFFVAPFVLLGFILFQALLAAFTATAFAVIQAKNAKIDITA